MKYILALLLLLIPMTSHADRYICVMVDPNLIDNGSVCVQLSNTEIKAMEAHVTSLEAWLERAVSTEIDKWIDTLFELSSDMQASKVSREEKISAISAVYDLHSAFDYIPAWFVDIAKDKAEACIDRIVKAASDKQHKKLSKVDKRVIVNRLDFEPASDERQGKGIGRRVVKP